MTTMESEYRLRITGRRQAADNVIALDLAALPGQTLPVWEPGAHIDVLLRPDLIRQYSLCGSPNDRQTWRIAVLLDAESRGGSAHIHDHLQPGDQVTVRGPRNHFELRPSTDYLFIAGGIGITPILPMISAVEQAQVPWQLFYGGRSRSSMAFLDALASYGSRVSIWPEDEAGRLDLAAIFGHVTSETLIYCCGPDGLLSAVEQRHRDPAVDFASADDPDGAVGALHVERFTPKLAEPVSANSAFEVTLRASERTVAVGPDQSILQALDAAGIDVAYSCEEGICGTCETRVCDGTPDHRDSILTPEEQAANRTMMICVSRSITPRLVLDL